MELSGARPGGRSRARRRPLGKLGLRVAAGTYLLLMVALPVATLAREGLSKGLGELGRAILHPVARAAVLLTLETALVMAAVNAVMGTLIAYVLVRYRFPGRKLLDVLIDLPFAIPTLVTGMMIVTLLGPHAALGQLFEAAGLRVVYAPPAIILALLFVTLPLVVRTVQPVLMELDGADEEAAYTLGASEWTTFRRVTLPAIMPAIVSGALQSFARALGEFGSVVVVAGNIPRRTLTAAVHVFGEVESGDVHAASAMSLVLVTIAFCVVLVVSARQRGAHG
ncbi:sulfate ABC transporter permease subunit CysT [Polyangium sp. y55x31]|uniref:sulfate ABC transporter permease subunit CysT n=1 Tax=Polyangium sp. y55x31 TaxID=3042688 RepID=UPI00248270A8|nr:sulfate ABC transporter permease subunit CysT [Polyangium sp. y55x31]MDI1483636.1 sulfate ABC transporter permease subunit CysT [Polyangium sp. y55x31]